MKTPIKRLLSVQDISCFGKCSLTVALPIVSAMGVECAVLPTAVLSTHTGCGFRDYTFHDLTEDIPAIARHWESLGLTFDTLESGYIGSARQAELVKALFDRFGDGAIRVIDPVMGDGGSYYAGFDRSFTESMKELCRGADVIVPNLTEVSFLLDIPYRPDADETTLRSLLPRLCEEVGCKSAVITGARPDAERQGAVGYVAATGEYCTAYNAHMDGSYHGTGDIFAAVLSGSLTRGMTLQESMQTAVDFTLDCICHTAGDDAHYYGVRFEEALPDLIRRLS
ncbi:MAG: pyridoxamine kinase [Clostridia bacterium]|nr:pyridoxamine kinase [Clostridia bacterium]